MVRFKVKQSESLKRPIEANGFFNPDISHCVEISDVPHDLQKGFS